MTMTSLDKAKEAAGGTVALARAIGISSQAVSQWEQVPATRVLDVERVTGISRHALRPDIYPMAEGERRSGEDRRQGERRDGEAA